jgi:hypothetical protein
MSDSTKILIDLTTTTTEYFSSDVVYVNVDGTVRKYERRLPKDSEISIDWGLSHGDYGLVREKSLTIKLDNKDEHFTDLFSTGEKYRGNSVIIRRYDPNDGSVSFEHYGEISEINLLDNAEISITLGKVAPGYQTDFPSKTYEPNDFTTNDSTMGIFYTSDRDTTAEEYKPSEDLGKPYNLCFGDCPRVPCIYIWGDTAADEYDYIIGWGPLSALNAVYRDKVLVDPSEYAFYNGSQASPYNGFAFIRFTKEQRDFSGNLYEISVHVDGLKLGETTSDLCTGGTPLASSEWPGGVYAASKAFDNNNSTYWSPAFGSPNPPISDNLPQWIQYSWTTAKVVNRVTMKATTSPSRMPGDFSVLASDTGAFSGEEVTLHSESGLTWTSGEQKTFDFTNIIAYKYYRIHITAVNDTEYLNIAEIEYLEVPGYTQNFAMVLKYIHKDANWGLGVTVDDDSFQASISAVSNLKCDGAIVEQRVLQDIVNDMLYVWNGRIYRGVDGNYNLYYDSYEGTVQKSFGSKDGFYENLREEGITRHGNYPMSEAIKTLTFQYRYSFWSEEYPVKTSRAVLSDGEDIVVDLPFVRDHTTADRILSFKQLYAQMADERQIVAEVGLEGETLLGFQCVKIIVPRWSITSNKIFRIIGIKKVGTKTTLTLINYTNTPYTYVAGTLQQDEPDDSGSDFPSIYKTDRGSIG